MGIPPTEDVRTQAPLTTLKEGMGTVVVEGSTPHKLIHMKLTEKTAKFLKLGKIVLQDRDNLGFVLREDRTLVVIMELKRAAVRTPTHNVSMPVPFRVLQQIM